MKRALLSPLALLLARPAGRRPNPRSPPRGRQRHRCRKPPAAGRWTAAKARAALAGAGLAAQLTALRAGRRHLRGRRGRPRATRAFTLVVVRGNGKTSELLPAPAIAAGEMALGGHPGARPGRARSAASGSKAKPRRPGAVKAAAVGRQRRSARRAPSSPAGRRNPDRAPGAAPAATARGWRSGRPSTARTTRSSGAAAASTAGARPRPSPTTPSPTSPRPCAATADGAMLVWSFYDGNDYRLKSATFRDWAWPDGEIFGGKGASLPSLRRALATPTLTFRQAEPEAWRVVEMTPKARKIRPKRRPRRRHPPRPTDPLHRRQSGHPRMVRPPTARSQPGVDRGALGSEEVLSA